MKILYYDCFMGISGDMNLGALIDLGVDARFLKDELKKLPVDGYELLIEKKLKKGISGTQVTVKLTGSRQAHHHRHWKEIELLIRQSHLNENVKTRAIQTFQILAEAEAKIHHKKTEEVHFHEVGAVDSIVDIVGAAICLEALKPAMVMASPVQLGGGMVSCEHGVFPVPAPATTEILKGKPVKIGGANFETTTPTGAALLATYVNTFTESIEFTIEKTGYGIGHKDAEAPNVLRVMLGDMNASSAYPADTRMVIETNIDDMSPEMVEAVAEQLFEAGASDVWITPIIMKKMRNGMTLSVIAAHEILPRITDILLHHTTSLGVRYYEVQRSMLERKTETVDTPWGKIRVKFSGTKENYFRAKPEYADCLEVARKNNIPLMTVIQVVQQIAFNKLKNK